jgi:hypothetical protein
MGAVDLHIEQLFLFAKNPENSIKIPQKTIDLLLSRVDLHRVSSVDLDHCETLARQQNSTLFAIVESFFLAVGQKLGRFAMSIGAHGFVSTAAKIDSTDDT